MSILESVKYCNYKKILSFCCFLFFASFGSVPVFATDSTLTLSTTGTSVSVSPSASGTFAESATPATISVTTDNYTGYALTLKSSSASAAPLTNAADSSVIIPSIPSAISQSTFQSSSDYVNQWGIKPSKLSGSDNSNYLSAPTTTGITLEQTSAANSTANTYNLYIATKLDYETPSGAYSTTLIATAVANLATYSITYADSSSSATNMPSAQSGTASSSSVTLSANSPTRDGYAFQGWCTTTVTDQDTTSPSCSGTTYTRGSGYSIDQTASNTVTLNAIWKQDILYMQDVATWGSTLAINEQVQAVDSRDGKLYWVARLCTTAGYSSGTACSTSEIWMTQNLDYDISATTNTISNNDGTTGTWTSSSSYAPQATTTSVFSSTSYTGTYSYDPGSKYLPSGSGTATDITCTSSSNGGSNCHYHLGNYYQYNAVTAGTGGTITSADATASICPVGWRLPTSNSYTNNYSFGKLTNAYGITSSSYGSSDTALLASPLWFVRAGHVDYGSLYVQGSYGYVWSSRAYSSTCIAYGLFFSSSNVNPSNSNSRNLGFSARCVAI